MTDLTSLTLAEARDGLATKSFTSVELTDAHLQAMERARVLNAYVLETPEQARAMARAADDKIAKGEGGPLGGIPLGIKDLFATKGVRTTACSKILDDFKPTYESTVTSQLWRDGAVLLGKLNNDEFAMGSSNETSCFGPVVNPWRRNGSDTKLVPGGSSGGSASAVAAGLGLGATGTDTGGSIRQPAAFAGIVGIKPTYGRCSRWGVVAFASSLDQAGPFARTVRDSAILIAALDPGDAEARRRGADDRGHLDRDLLLADLGERVVGASIVVERERAALCREIIGAQPVLPHDDGVGRDRADLLDEAREVEGDLRIVRLIVGGRRCHGLRLAEPVNLHHPGHDRAVGGLPDQRGRKPARERQ